APLPGSTGPIVALAAWRGRLLPAIDVRPLLGISSALTSALLVIGDDELDAALLVDSAQDLHEVASTSVQSLPPGGARSGVLRGALADGTPLLDIAEVLRLARAST